MTDYAKPCPKCGEYYPGDCADWGCMDEKCECDGCEAYREMKGDDYDDC